MAKTEVLRKHVQHFLSIHRLVHSQAPTGSSCQKWYVVFAVGGSIQCADDCVHLDLCGDVRSGVALGDDRRTEAAILQTHSIIPG